MSWSKDLERLTTKGGHDLGTLAKAVKIEMFSGITRDTRVGDAAFWKSKPPEEYVGGRLRGNWQIQESSPASGELDRIDKTGDKVKAEILKGATKNGKTFFVNNLPYAKIFEEKDAMVRKNVIRVMQNVKSMAKKIKG
jgi:hypothetical protein